MECNTDSEEMTFTKTLGYLGQKTRQERKMRKNKTPFNDENWCNQQLELKSSQSWCLLKSVRTQSTTEKAIWHHQSPANLQMQDLNYPRQLMHEKTILKITGLCLKTATEPPCLMGVYVYHISGLLLHPCCVYPGLPSNAWVLPWNRHWASPPDGNICTPD